MSITSEFKKTHPIEKRKAEAKRIKDRFVDRIPVIVEKAPKSDVPLIDKKKFLVPCDLTVGQFLYVIRKRISMKSEAALFVFVQQSLLPAGMLMSQVYKENADEDGFLYITYSSEDSFG